MKPYRPIRGRDIDGAYCTSEVRRLVVADQRRERARDGVCINGRSHGKATHGVRCEHCWLVYKHGAAVVGRRAS